MKVNLNSPFLDFKGNPLTENGKVAMVSERIASHLFSVSTLRKEPLPADKKYLAYKLCNAIMRDPTSVELSTEDAAFVKDVCSEAFTPGAYGQIVDAIENNNR